MDTNIIIIIVIVIVFGVKQHHKPSVLLRLFRSDSDDQGSCWRYT